MYDQLRILIVDDSRIIRQIVRTTLLEMGIGWVDEADDGYDALSTLDSDPYDLVLLDWAMPKMNGLQLLKLLRGKDGPNKGVYIIMVTAESHKENIVVAVKSGANDYVVKPFQTETLRHKIETGLAKAMAARRD